MEPKTESNKLSVPLAIVFAGILVAGAVLYNGEGSAGAKNTNQQVPTGQAQDSLNQMRPISGDDHIRGSVGAEVTIVEYSDTECPFCKQFHSTLKQVVGEYNGKVAWVYRHFPLAQLHSKAPKEAEALECANELGGNDKFWQYTDRIYEVTPTNNGLDPAELPKIATYVGLDAAKFSECLDSGKFKAKVNADLEDAIATGGNGTPWSIVVTKDGKQYPLSGAQPYDAVKELVDIALKGE